MEHNRNMIYYDFEDGLSEEKRMERLQLAFSTEAASRATIFRSMYVQIDRDNSWYWLRNSTQNLT